MHLYFPAQLDARLICFNHQSRCLAAFLFHNLQKHLLTLIETVWHLCEILFIETLPGKTCDTVLTPSQLHRLVKCFKITTITLNNLLLFLGTGGAVLHHLLEWVQNGHADKYVKDVLQHSQPHDSPSYWPAVSVLSTWPWQFKS